jgi:hypothetical protein
MDLREIYSEGGDQIKLAQHNAQYRAFMDTAMNFHGMFLMSCVTIIFLRKILYPGISLHGDRVIHRHLQRPYLILQGKIIHISKQKLSFFCVHDKWPKLHKKIH